MTTGTDCPFGPRSTRRQSDMTTEVRAARSKIGPVMVAGRNPLKSEVRVGAVIAMADGPFGRARQRMPTAFLSACSNGSPLSGR